MRRTTSVTPALHATRRQRTRRMRRASAMTASSSDGRPSGAAMPSVALRSGDANRSHPAGSCAGVRTQPIAHSPDGLDETGLVAELVAQVVDVGIDRIGGHGDAVRPRVIEELFASEHLVGMAEEALEQR